MMRIWPAAAGAWFAQSERSGFWRGVLDISLICRMDTEQRTDFADVGLADIAGQQAVVADAVEAFRKHVDQEAADELGRCQAHDLLAVTRTLIR